ncbi:DUF4302 domain-containing protein [Sphingobacterium paucimobilis]|nr:DUF4302 domain-containing protein [Sphingobacterium paucimobilis]
MRILYIVALSMMLLMGCQKNTTEPILGQLDIRLKESLDNYRKILSSNTEGGWTGTLQTGTGDEFEFNFVFDAEGKVNMASDMSVASMSERQLSTYALQAIQVPSLTFDTHNYIHELADPRPEAMGGDRGHGLYADFEFEILKYEKDTLYLRGIKYKNDFKIVKATEDYIEKFKGPIEKYNKTRALLAQYKTYPFKLGNGRLGDFKMFEGDFELYVLMYNKNNKGTPGWITVPYEIDEQGLHFDEVTIGGTKLQDLLLDAGKTELLTKMNGQETSTNTTNPRDFIGVNTEGKLWRFFDMLTYLDQDGNENNGFAQMMKGVKADLKSKGVEFDYAYIDLYNLSGTNYLYFYLDMYQNGTYRRATWQYKIQMTSTGFNIVDNGSITLGIGADGNLLAPITAYFNKKNFTFVWNPGYPSSFLSAGFAPVSSPNDIGFGGMSTLD